MLNTYLTEIDQYNAMLTVLLCDASHFITIGLSLQIQLLEMSTTISRVIRTTQKGLVPVGQSHTCIIYSSHVSSEKDTVEETSQLQ